MILSNGVWWFVYYKFIIEKYLGDIPVKMDIFGKVLYPSGITILTAGRGS